MECRVASVVGGPSIKEKVYSSSYILFEYCLSLRNSFLQCGLNENHIILNKHESNDFCYYTDVCLGGVLYNASDYDEGR